jgi:multicomponent Na+:H+ antiporter subunit F
MSDYLMFAAFIVLATVAVGLFRVLRGPAKVDRLMAAQLLGSGGVAVLLLIGVATDVSYVVDVALTLAVLAAFASGAFVINALRPPPGAAPEGSE